MEKKRVKDQFVIACLESPAMADAVLPCARYCAERLRKGIIVLNVSRDGQSDWLKQYGLPYVGLKGDWKTAVDGLPTAFGGVLAVTAVDRHAPRTSITHPATLLRTFADCKIAYLVVESGKLKVGNDATQSASAGSPLSALHSPLSALHSPLSTLHSPLSALHSPLSTFLTLDHRRESKEKLVWGSYMVRFFGSRLNIVTPAYSDAGLREKVHNNVLFMKKIYKSLNVDYTLSPFTFRPAPFTSPDRALLSTLHSQPPALLIAMTTDRRDRDLGDLLFGNPECRLLAAAQGIPILFLNQRDDLYVLCD